jgi:hypothetical protein
MTASNAAASAAASPRDSWLARSPTWVLFLLVFAGGAAVLAAVIIATVVLGSAIVSEFENTADPGDAAEAVTAVSTDATEPRVAIDCGEYEGVVCQGSFTDEPGVTDDPQRIEDAISLLVGNYGNPIAVVVVRDSRGATPADFAADLANAWGVGDPVEENGILVLVSLDERRTEVVAQDGISVPGDAIASSAQSFFSADDFDGGLLAIVESLDTLLEAKPGAANPALSVLVNEAAAAIDSSGYFVEHGVTGNLRVVPESSRTAKTAGGQLSIVVLSTERAAHAETIADLILDALGGTGTVLVVAPETVGWASENDIYAQPQLDKALDASLDATTDMHVVELFVTSLTG